MANLVSKCIVVVAVAVDSTWQIHWILEPKVACKYPSYDVIVIYISLVMKCRLQTKVE